MVVVVFFTDAGPLLLVIRQVAWPLYFSAVVIAAGLIVLRLVRTAESPVLAMPMVFLVVFGALVVGTLFLEPGFHQTDPSTRAPAVPRSVFIRDGRSALLVLGQEGARLRRTVAVTFDELPRMRYAEELLWDAAGGIAVDPRTGASVPLRVAILPHRFARLQPAVIGLSRTLIYGVLEAVGGVRGDLRQSATHTGSAVIALAFALGALWFPARATRWPILNAALVAFAIAVTLLVPAAAHQVLEWFPEYAALFSRQQRVAVVWGLCAAALFATRMFMPNIREWRRNTFHQGG